MCQGFSSRDFKRTPCLDKFASLSVNFGCEKWRASASSTASPEYVPFFCICSENSLYNSPIIITSFVSFHRKYVRMQRKKRCDYSAHKICKILNEMVISVQDCILKNKSAPYHWKVSVDKKHCFDWSYFIKRKKQQIAATCSSRYFLCRECRIFS